MKTLERRTFLRGMGLSMGLPLLEVMQPKTAFGAAPTGDGAHRMAFVFFPNGAIMQQWTPEESGDAYQLSDTLSALEDFQSDFNVISGLAQDNGRAKGDGPGDHARCASTYLTGAHPYKTSGADIRVGVSVDQAASKQVGDRTRLPSIELGIKAGRNAGNCDSGYSCAYSSNVSWKSESTPMAKEINPRAAFERLFGTGVADESRRRRDFYRKSILDLVQSAAAKLNTQLGVTDRRKVEEYFQSVRDLEKRVIQAEEAANIVPPDVDLPEGIPGEFQQHVRLMYDIMVLAFQTDTTRIATFMLGNAGSNRSYSMVGVNEGHHQLSHHRNDEVIMGKIQKIDRFLAEQFAYFLKRLRETEDGTGSLLDNSMVLYGSGLSDGNRHDHADLPIVLAGKGRGSIAPGRHIKTDGEVPLNNLFLSLLDRMDAGIESIGDSSGRFTQIDA